jgi:signal transduction histidine kinase
MAAGPWRDRKPAAYCLLLAGALAVSTLASWTQLGAQIDNDAYDYFFRLYEPPAWQPQCAVIAIDEESLAGSRGIYGLRSAVAEALERISSAKPLTAAVDIILHDGANEDDDARLERAMASTPNLVLAADLLPDGRGWEDPLPRFGRHAAAVGHVHGQPDEFDSVIRHVVLEKRDANHKRRWALALEAYRVSRAAAIVESPQDLSVGDTVIPVARREDRAMRVRYRPPGAGPIPSISLAELRRRPERVAELAGKTVFIGVTAQTAARDRPMTPYSFGMIVPGVEVHAHAFETIANRLFLARASEWSVLLASIGIVAAAGAIFWFLPGWNAYPPALALLGLAHALPYALFTQRIVFPFLPPVSAAWLSLLGAGVSQYFAVRRSWQRAEGEKGRYQQAMHFVTHEMRTPLTAIQGSSELMGRYSSMPDEKRKQIAGLINSESKRLGRMISTFLTVERLSAGQMELKRESFSAGELVNTCVDRASPLAERKQIRVEVEDPIDGELSGDRELMEYALYNLLTNAIKYSPAKTEVTAGARREGSDVRIFVRDQGIGMDQKEVGKLFQKFYRTRRAEESGEAGTGIGLSIVKEIVRQHSGTIEVTSRPGAGSCFTLVLPALTSAAAG